MTTAVSSGENFIAVVRDGSSNDLSGPALSLYWINDTGLRATLGDAVARFNPLSSLRVSLSPASMSATEGGRWRSTLAPATGYFQGRGRMAAALAPATAAFVGKGQLRATLAPITATFIGKGRLIASLSPAVTQAFVLNKYWLGISADTFSASAAPDGMVEVVVRETLALTSSTLGGASFSVNSIDLLRVSDVCRQLIELFVEESVTVSDLAAGDPLKIADLVDSLISTGTSSGQHDALISIAVAMAIIEAAEAGFIADAVASISAVDATAARAAFIAGALSDILATAQISGSRSIVAIAPEILSLLGASGAQADYNSLEARSSASFDVALVINGEVYTGWVFNAKTMAASEYQNFSFDSMCGLNGRYYGVNSGGLYLLDGDDDAGVSIDTRILTGEMDFSSPQIKRIEQAYIGYTSTGNLVLKVIATHAGKRMEYWYRADNPVPGEPTETRVVPGKGLVSRYFQFELVNVDGAGFDIDRIDFRPVNLSRRI